MHLTECKLTQALEKLTRAEIARTLSDPKTVDSIFGSKQQRKLECKRVERRIEIGMAQEIVYQERTKNLSFGEY